MKNLFNLNQQSMNWSKKDQVESEKDQVGTKLKGKAQKAERMLGEEDDVRVVRLEGGSNEHPISIQSASIEHPLQSGGNQVASRYLAHIWKYAAMLLMLVTLGVGQMWG